MVKGKLKIRVTNPHKSGDITDSLLHEILRQAGISKDEWNKYGLKRKNVGLPRSSGRWYWGEIALAFIYLGRDPDLQIKCQYFTIVPESVGFSLCPLCTL